jgi:hypothetical protein
MDKKTIIDFSIFNREDHISKPGFSELQQEKYI